MLQELHIKNFGVIESMQLDFQPGFLAISGETGAGKSILLQAIAFVMGERADSDLIRTGAEEGSVLMILSAPKDRRVQAICEQIGVSYPSDGEFILRRSLHLSGKSRAYINDEPVTLKTLQSFTQATIHLVRQHASHQLFEEDFLLDRIDQYGELEKIRESYRDAFQQYREASQALSELTSRVQNTRQQEEFLRYQFEELTRSNLRAGEEEELEEIKKRLKNRVAITTASYEISQGLSESDQSIANQLGKLVHAAEKTAGWDSAFQPIFLKLQEASSSIDEISREVLDYQQKLEGDPEELEQLEERLALISELKRKYRTDEAGLLKMLEELQTKVGEIENFDHLLEKNRQEVEKFQKALQTLAEELHKKRIAVLKQLQKKLLKSLSELALPKAQLVFQLEKIPNLENFRSNGGDRLSLLISFNPGEAMRPFDEIISGGELSRLFLAFCEILYSAEQLGTLIFDEIDSGVGGGVAELIGKKLELLSSKTQVLSVTHLPQIACRAQGHYHVSKEVREGRTFSQVKLLQKAEREVEIARMLAGVEVTAQALRHARELITNAECGMRND